MNRILQAALVTIVSACFPMLGQNLGDQATAGFNDSRTYLNSDAGDFKPPLELDRTLSLPEGTTAQTLSVFEDYVLIGQGGEAAHYSLLDSETGSEVWRFDLPTNTPDTLNYVPAINGDIVLLGGSTSTSVTAVEVSTGNVLWQDNRVGSSDGRFPLLLDDLALYSGEWGVVAARPSDGTLVWQYPPSAELGSIHLAKAPLSRIGSRVYVLTDEGSLTALDLLTGVPIWSAPEIGSDGSNIIATRKFVYVSNQSDGRVNAVRTSDGSVAWSVEFAIPFAGHSTFGNPGIALAYDQLLVFSGTPLFSSTLENRVAALAPETGEFLWQSLDYRDAQLDLEPPPLPHPPQFVQIANNAVYFFNSWAEDCVRTLDAFSGNVHWSSSQSGTVQSLSVVKDTLFVLFANELKIYRPLNTIYLPQFADGMGASTLITLANLTTDEATGTVEFLDDDGNPAPVEVEGSVGAVSSLDFVLERYGCVAIQTAGATNPLVKGWARVTASRPIRERPSTRSVSPATSSSKPESGTRSRPGWRASSSRLVPQLPETGLAPELRSRILWMSGRPLTLRFPTRPMVYLDASITLEPGQHVAKFIDELFPDLVNTDVTGTLIISSEIPVVVTALRTRNGYPMSSYPVGIP